MLIRAIRLSSQVERVARVTMSRPESCSPIRMGEQLTFDADFYQLPDGTVATVIRSHWPKGDDVVEVLSCSDRRDPKRVDAFLGGAVRSGGRSGV